MLINTTQSRCIHALLNKLNEMAWKVDYVNEVSNGRTSHINEITTPEAAQLISDLREVEKGYRPAKNPTKSAAQLQDDERNTANLMRRRILKCCHQMGWYEKDAVTGNLKITNGRPVLDFKRINDYCLKHSAAHKKLNDHTATELKGKGGLVYQFETMERNYIHHSK